MAINISSKNQGWIQLLSEYGERSSKTFGPYLPNVRRIDLESGCIDGFEVDTIERTVAEYDQKRWFKRLWQRIFTDIEKKRALLCYYYVSEYTQALNASDEPVHAFWRKARNIRMARAIEGLEKHRSRLSYFSRMRIGDHSPNCVTQLTDQFSVYD